jgi:hypothetical protein
MDPNEIDAASKKVATHPRVALADIEAAIASVYYTNGERVREHATHTDNKQKQFYRLDSFTICMVVMKNGFIVVGSGAPASPENFDAELGRKLAYDQCIKQLWPLMGFALRDKLTGNP